MDCLLMVDDEPYNLFMMEEFLGGGHQLVTASNGLEAWQMLDLEPARYDAVILDRCMPVMDGMETLQRIRADARFRLMPVIMQTAANSPAEVAEGLAAGAWYYLAKPYDGAALVNIVKSALNDRASHLELERLDTDINDMLKMTMLTRYTFHSPGEARRLAVMLARFSPENAGLSMGLTELMLNAVEHGNLGISYAEKSEFLSLDTLPEELCRRLADPLLGSRRAMLEIAREDSCLRFTIRDEGAGFDWQNYLEFDPARAFDSHGRGIAIARQMAFDSLEYLGTGSAVTVTVQFQEKA
jgi:CheY-like chemotaxis protein